MAPQKFTLQQRIYLVEYYFIQKNYGTVGCHFATQFPDVRIPHGTTILNLVKTFSGTVFKNQRTNTKHSVQFTAAISDLIYII